MALDPATTVTATRRTWDDHIQPALTRYIEVPALSVAFDPDWEEHGHLDAVVDSAAAWAEQRAITGLTVEVVRLPGRTPVLWFEVPAFGGGADDDTVLLYGHLDKQPPMTGWREGLGPWTPVLDGDRLLAGVSGLAFSGKRRGLERGGDADLGFSAVRVLSCGSCFHGCCAYNPHLPVRIEKFVESITGST